MSTSPATVTVNDRLTPSGAVVVVGSESGVGAVVELAAGEVEEVVGAPVVGATVVVDGSVATGGGSGTAG